MSRKVDETNNNKQKTTNIEQTRRGHVIAFHGNIVLSLNCLSSDILVQCIKTNYYQTAFAIY